MVTKRVKKYEKMMTLHPHPLRRGGLAVKGTSASILWWGTANRDDLPVHHGLLNRAPESLSPMLMAELDKKEDIIRENEYLEKTNKEERGNCKQESKEERKFWERTVIRNQMSTPFKRDIDSFVTSGSWSGATTHPHSRMNREFSICTLYD